MTYEWDEQASKEAADYPVSVPDADTLRRQCSQKAADLGPGGVSGHTVCFSLTAWDEPPGLVQGVPRTGRISRGDVLGIGQQVRAGARPATDLLAASFIWGWGATGYGPHRVRDIRAAAGDRLEPALRRALDAVHEDPASPDPVAGYTCLYGGYDHHDRAAVDSSPNSPASRLGPPGCPTGTLRYRRARRP